MPVVCFDAKINFDDSAKFRQKEIFAMEDTSESDPREVEAASYDLNYIGMTGNIGCLGTMILCLLHCYLWGPYLFTFLQNSNHWSANVFFPSLSPQ